MHSIPLWNGQSASFLYFFILFYSTLRFSKTTASQKSRSLKWTTLERHWKEKTSRDDTMTFSHESFFLFFRIPVAFTQQSRHTWDVLHSHEHTPVATQFPLAVGDGATQTKDGLPLLWLSREFPPVVETNTLLDIRCAAHMPNIHRLLLSCTEVYSGPGQSIHTRDLSVP